MCLATTLSYNSFQPLNLLGVLKVCMCAHIFICFTAHARTYISVCVCIRCIPSMWLGAHSCSTLDIWGYSAACRSASS